MKGKYIFQAVLFLCMMVLIAPAAQAQLLGMNWDTGDLYDVSTTDGSLSVIGNTGLTWVGGLAYNGTLYGVTSGSDASLYSIDTSTASATLVGSTGISYIIEGTLAFDSSGTLWMADSDAGGAEIYTLDTTTGAATYQGTVTGKSDLNGLAFRSDGTLIGIESFTDTIFSINLTTFAATDIASFGFGIGDVSGLANMGDTGYMATGRYNGTNSLYEVNLITGSTSLIGSFDITSGDGISGLALAVPEPATMLLLGFGLIGIGASRRRLK